MARVCTVCGKAPVFGNNRSHSMRATSRRFEPNVQKVRIIKDGAPVRAYVCARCLKGGKVLKAV
jgi:large subunit ribosomal protein L28